MLNNLGGVFDKLGKYDQASAVQRRALAIQRTLAGPEHIATFNSLRGIGIVEDHKGNWKAALDSFRAAYAVAHRQHIENEALVSDALINMARLLQRLHRPDESRELSLRALGVQKRLFGSNHPHVAFTCHNWGTCWRSRAG